MVVTRVDPNSAAADKRIQPGDVIVEVGQEPVSTPADVTRRVDALKSEGRKSALLLVVERAGRGPVRGGLDRVMPEHPDVARRAARAALFLAAGVCRLSDQIGANSSRR